jgi:hypothetical protein
LRRKALVLRQRGSMYELRSHTDERIALRTLD